MKQLIFVIAFLLPVLCKGQNTENMNTKIEKLLKEGASSMKQYSPKPMYYIQVSKQACRVLVSINDILMGHQFVEDEGQTMLLPINA